MEKKLTRIIRLDRVGQIYVYRCGDLSLARKLAEDERREGFLVFARSTEQSIEKLERLDGTVCVVKEELDTEYKLDMDLRMDTCFVMFADGSTLFAVSEDLVPLKRLEE